jgi:hypothetical protein
MFTRKLVIDRSIWRCGQRSPFHHGKGFTVLLNDEGYMCCLGQACIQLGMQTETIKYHGTPEEVLREETYLTYKVNSYDEDENEDIVEYFDTKFSDEAIAINDSKTLSRTGRELSLYLLGKRYGILVQFIGEYTT